MPDFEASSFCLGISDDHPLLLYRTGSEKYPFVKPKGSQAYRTSKSVRGVYDTPLNAVWSTVGPLVRDLIKTQNIRYTSIDVARFITHDTDQKDIPGSVVIWIGVYPGSTTADTAHGVSENILGLLQSYGIEGVEVEWRESVFWRAVGPPLLRTVGNNHTTVDVRGALTATLGVPIATAERPDAQGSVGFFFHEGRDEQGDVSDRVLAVTCHHVLFETTKTHNFKYELKEAGAPRKYVRLRRASGTRSLPRTGVPSRSTRLGGRRYSGATFWIWVRFDSSFSHLRRLTRSILIRNHHSSRQAYCYDVPSQRR